MKERNAISLQLLFLNDLLHTNVIDQSIYDKAVQKLTEKPENTISIVQPVILASA